MSTRSYAKNSNTESTYSLTTNSYAWKAGAVQAYTTYKPDTSQSTVHNTAYSNSKSGVLLSAQITDGRTRTVSFINDNSGQVLRRDESDTNASNGDPHEIWYRFGGKEMGYIGTPQGALSRASPLTLITAPPM